MDLNLQLVSNSNERAKALKAFDDTKTGVKGLVDAGITTIPQIFVLPNQKEEVSPDESNSGSSCFKLPVIDLAEMNKDYDCLHRKQVVEEIKHACETWGFFKILNHGIPQDLMDEMVEGVRRFNEQSKEEKMKIYSREKMRKVREIMMKYSYYVKKLGQTLFQLVSEALGLDPNYLENMECVKGQAFFCHYYPVCPEPDRKIGHAKHTDPDFLTILLQDHIGGLQVRHQNQWVNVPPERGDLVVNVGDLLQLISNDKFKSVEHRVLANSAGPRISVAFFFTTHFQESDKVFGPIKELLTNESPPLYKETLVKDYINLFHSEGLGGIRALDQLRL
ncbi:hypothetical protein UlMin_030059 [Ulmus minor]